MGKKSDFQMVLAIASAVAITTFAAVLNGHLSNRWGRAASTTDAAKAIESLPREIGDWQVREETVLSPSAVQMLQCAGYINRIYFNRRTGDALGVTVLLGPPGPMTVHTPEVCFSSREFLQAGQPERVRLQVESHPTGEFYRVMFRPTSPTATSLEVLYGWNDRNGWSAPDAPRFAFGGSPYIFKIQIVSQLWPNVAFGEDGVAANFLKEFVKATSENFKNSLAE